VYRIRKTGKDVKAQQKGLQSLIKKKEKAARNYKIYKWQLIALRPVGRPIGNRLTDGSKVVSPTHRPRFTPQKYYLYASGITRGQANSRD
jgi:hypothetical protein